MAMRNDVQRLEAELSRARKQADGFLEKLLELRSAPPDPNGVRVSEAARSREFWHFVKAQAHDVLSKLGPESPGLTTKEIIEKLPETVRERADREGEVINSQNLSKRLYESALRKRLFDRDGERYRPLQGQLANGENAA